MGLKTEEAVVTVVEQGCDLFFPAHTARSEGPPDRLIPFHVTVFGVDVYNALFLQLRIPAGERIFARHQGVCRVPDKHQIRMRRRTEKACRFARRSDVASVLVF